MKAQLDVRFIYLLVLAALVIPLVTKYSIPPARLESADKFYQAVEKLTASPRGAAFVALDYGPNTIAENGAQAEVVIEHLMRRRIPVMLFSIYSQAEPFLVSLPERIAARLATEQPGERWEYGIDWVNLGYRPGGYLIIQAIPKAENLADLFQKDARGARLADLPIFSKVKNIKDIVFLAQFTGLLGTFDNYVQFFQADNYRPVFGHGCTSITIPEAYIYLDSGQLVGLLEGIAGAAWYSHLLTRDHPQRPKDSAELLNTGLGVAHLVIILLIVIGNITFFLSRRGAHQ